MMNLDIYNSTFIEILDSIDEEADQRLNSIRKKCVHNLVNQITRRHQEWDDAYAEILKKSQEIDEISLPPIQAPKPQSPKLPTVPENPKPPETPPLEPPKAPEPVAPIETNHAQAQIAPKISQESEAFLDPYFSNQYNVQEYMRIQALQEEAKSSCCEISNNPALKGYKSELVMLIRTQINSISNSDSGHLNTKIRLFTDLLNGQSVNFQNRVVNSSQHPQAQAFCLYTTAQIIVTVGSRLVNSVPAIANTMAQLIEGIVRNNYPVLKDLVIGNLQERCPYVIPISPQMSDFGENDDDLIKYKIACGYNYDSSSKTLEPEDKYLIRMRSMILIYSCILVQDHLDEAWTWLASFLSLKPQPVITATILQAFLQEVSKKMSSRYGRQYKKVIVFIRNCYIKMIEDVTPKGVDRQSLIKLKNLLSDDMNLFATPNISSIFRPHF